VVIDKIYCHLEYEAACLPGRIDRFFLIDIKEGPTSPHLDTTVRDKCLWRVAIPLILLPIAWDFSIDSIGLNLLSSISSWLCEPVLRIIRKKKKGRVPWLEQLTSFKQFHRYN
jgi:hypothetical protein